VSRRRVARDLGTTTLDGDIRARGELVALMDDQRTGDLLDGGEALGVPGRDAFTAILGRTFRLQVGHPGSRIALQIASWGADALRHAEPTMASFANPTVHRHMRMAVADRLADGNALTKRSARSRLR
jgi:hypothetical protein